MNVLEFNQNRNIIKVDNQLFLKEFELKLEEIRLILLTMAQINSDDEDFKTYKIYIKDIEEKTGTLKNSTRIKKMINELLKKVINIDNRIFTHWFSSIEILEKESALEVCFDPKLKPYLLKLKEKFVKLNLEELLKLKSVYAIRFYIIAKTYTGIGQIKFNLNDLHLKLKTPSSYKKNFSDFKKRVLDIAEEEINAKTDIKICFEYLKKGKKTTDIILKIKNTKLVECKRTEQPQKAVDTFKNFRQEISKSNVIIALEDEYFEIKDNYIWQDEKLLSKEKALEVWKKLFENKDKLRIIENKEKFEKEQKEKRKEKIKQELLKAYFGKRYEHYTKNVFGGDELLYYEILKIEDITFKDDGTIDIITFTGRGEDGLNYKINTTLNKLKLYTN